MSALADAALLIVFSIAGTPLVVAVHEAGHLIPALLLADGPLRVRVGAVGGTLATARAGRVTFVLTRRPFAGSGEVTMPPGVTGRHAAAILAGGPAATLLTGLGVAFLGIEAAARGGPHAAVLACIAVGINSLVLLGVNGGRTSRTDADGTPVLSDGEKLARLAGAQPRAQTRRTHPIAWILLALIAGAHLLTSGLSEDQLAAVAILGALLFLLGRIALAERRQRAR